MKIEEVVVNPAFIESYREWLDNTMTRLVLDFAQQRATIKTSYGKTPSFSEYPFPVENNGVKFAIHYGQQDILDFIQGFELVKQSIETQKEDIHPDFGASEILKKEGYIDDGSTADS